MLHFLLAQCSKMECDNQGDAPYHHVNIVPLSMVRLNIDIDVADTVLGKGVTFKILLNKTVTVTLILLT